MEREIKGQSPATKDYLLEDPGHSEVVLFKTGTKPSFQFDSETRRVVVNSMMKSLTPSEYKLLRMLIDGQGRVVINHELRSGLPRSGKPQASGNSLRVCVSNLRRKLQNPERSKLIENVRGVGYRFNMTPSEIERTEELEYRLSGGRKYYPESNMIEIDGERNYLTGTENRLLWLLAEKLNEVLSKEELAHEVWGIGGDINQQSLLKGNISRLRRKIADSRGKDGKYRFIHSVRGIGYRLYDEDKINVPTR